MFDLLLEVFINKLTSIAEEMGIVLQRTAFSPNIKERKDLSCAIFNRKGELVAQAEHIPVHLGSMPLSVRTVIEEVSMEEGDMVLLNDPYRGGTHLPDLTLVAPVFYDGELLFFVASRAHHADVGGSSAGSMPLSRSVFQEGLIIPPVKLIRKGEVNRDVLKLILSNVRTPHEREGDLKAQMMANKVGIERIKELVEEFGTVGTLERCESLLSYSEKLMKKVIGEMPEGTYEFEDFIEDDGFGNEKVGIRVKVRIGREKVEVDFSDSDPQTEGPLNAVRSITLASTYYVFRCFLPPNVPTNDGCFRPIEVITKKGTVVDAEFPSPVSGGNVETSQRIVDVLLGALSKAIPETVPAASQGTMNNLTIGGRDPRTGVEFTYYETIGGGTGAWSGGDGESAVHSHMTNTMNTPVEALEHSYPLLVREYSIRKNSGGMGLRRGGDGIVREIEMLTEGEVTVISERRKIPPYGLFGGSPGEVGRNSVVVKGMVREMPGKFSLRLGKGDRVRIETPGGGGYA